VAGVVVLAPSVLAIFGGQRADTWRNLSSAPRDRGAAGDAVAASPHARTRCDGGDRVRDPHRLLDLGSRGGARPSHGAFPITRDWFSLGGIGGHGSLPRVCSSRCSCCRLDSHVYVNEEVKHRRHNRAKAPSSRSPCLSPSTLLPGGLAGVFAAKLQANSSSVLVTRQALGGGPRPR